MPRLNDQFMETLTNADGTLRIVPDGYVFAEHEQDGMTAEVRLTPYDQPVIDVRGTLDTEVVKGGVELDEGGITFVEGGLFDGGLYMGFEDELGMRRYWITDSDSEEVLVAVWDPNATRDDPIDGPMPGRFGDYSPASPEEAASIKEIAKVVIDAGRIAIESRLGPS